MCIPNPRRVDNIVGIHGPLDGLLYMGSYIHQQSVMLIIGHGLNWICFLIKKSSQITPSMLSFVVQL